MADSKISALNAATALAGTEVLPVVQGGATVKATVNQVRTSATPVSGTTATFNGSTKVTGGFSINTYNAAGVYPPNDSGVAVGWNFTNGGGEVDYWNTYDGGIGGFSWWQKTGASAHVRRMNLSVGGNLTIDTGDITAQSIVPNAAPSSKWAIDGTNAGLLVTIADTATYDLAAGSGVTYLWDNGGNGVGVVYTFYGSVSFAFNPSAFYSATKDTPSLVNFYYNAGTGTYRLQNLTGSSKSIYVFTMRLRASS